MRHPLIRTAVLGAIFTTTHAYAAPPSCSNPIGSVPYVISAPGTYCLNQDLVSAATGSAAAITINADNVQLDLDGHSIDGPGGNTAGLGIHSLAHRGLRIRNGTLRGFRFGVNIDDYLVGFPATDPSGASTRHEVSNMRVEGGYIGIWVLGHFSSVHDNVVFDTTYAGIATGSSYVAGKTGAINVRGNQVFNAIGSMDSSQPVYGISAAGTGSVVQDNVVTTVRGPKNSAAIFAGGVSMIVTHNREADLGSAYPVACQSFSPPSAKVDNNTLYSTSPNGVVYQCSEPQGAYFNSNF